MRESNKRDFKVQCPVMESNFHQNWFEPRIRNRTAAPFCSRTKSGVETIKFIRQRFSHNRAMPAEPVPWPSLICLCWEVPYRQGVLHRRTITFWTLMVVRVLLAPESLVGSNFPSSYLSIPRTYLNSQFLSQSRWEETEPSLYEIPLLFQDHFSKMSHARKTLLTFK